MKHDSLTAHPRDERGLSEKRIGWPIQAVQISSASCRTATDDGAGRPAKFHNSFHDRELADFPGASRRDDRRRPRREAELGVGFRVIMPVDNPTLERVGRTLEEVRSAHGNPDDVISRLKRTLLPDTIA